MEVRRYLPRKGASAASAFPDIANVMTGQAAGRMPKPAARPRTDFAPPRAGQAVPLVRNLPAAALIEALVAESQLWLPRHPVH
jgi:hypothetical protein